MNFSDSKYYLFVLFLFQSEAMLAEDKAHRLDQIILNAHIFSREVFQTINLATIHFTICSLVYTDIGSSTSSMMTAIA